MQKRLKNTGLASRNSYTKLCTIHTIHRFTVSRFTNKTNIAGVAKPVLCMSRISQNPSYKEPQHKNLKTRIYLQSTLMWHHNSFWNNSILFEMTK